MSSGVARSDAEAACGTPLAVSGVTRDGVARAGRPDDARGSRALGGRGRGADVADGGAVVEGGRGVSAVISEARIVPRRPRAVLSPSRGGSGVKLEKPSVARTVIRRADADAARLRARGHPSRSRLGQNSRRTPRDSTRSGRRGSHCGASAAGAHAFSPRALFVTGLGDGKNTKARYAPTFFIHAVRPPLLSVACTTRRPRTRRHAPRSSHVCRRARRREGLGPRRGHSRARGVQPRRQTLVRGQHHRASPSVVGAHHRERSRRPERRVPVHLRRRRVRASLHPRARPEIRMPSPQPALRTPARSIARPRQPDPKPPAPIRRTTRPLTSTPAPLSPRSRVSGRPTRPPRTSSRRRRLLWRRLATRFARSRLPAPPTPTPPSKRASRRSRRSRRSSPRSRRRPASRPPSPPPRPRRSLSSSSRSRPSPRRARARRVPRVPRVEPRAPRRFARFASARWRRSATRARNPSRTDSIARTPRRSFRRRTRVSRRALRWRVSWRLFAAGSRRVASSASSRFCRWRMIRARSSCTAIRSAWTPPRPERSSASWISWTWATSSARAGW